MGKTRDRQAEVIEQFVASFTKFDEMSEFIDIEPIAGELRTTETDQFGQVHWRPAKISTDPAALEPLYAKLPARFPRLYEHLVLSYRWAQVDLGRFRLLANPPGEDLSRLMREISLAPDLYRSLIPAGYIPFGKGPDMDFDPVCFEIRSRTRNHDYRIVKIDHEEILCNHRLKIVTELAPSFEALVLETIQRAKAS